MRLSAKSTKEFLGKVAVRYAIIVCEEAEKRCPRVFPFTMQTLAWPFDDPIRVEGAPEMQLARFRRVRDEIDVARPRVAARTRADVVIC